MPMTLAGKCNCGAVSYTLDSHTPYPYMRCYCNACRRTAGGGGYAINIMGRADSLAITGHAHLGKHGILSEKQGAGPARRSFCVICGTMLWNFDPTWPDLIHPFASSVETDLPKPPHSTHIMLAFKAPWVTPDIKDGDAVFDHYPNQSIEAWHRSNGLWID